MEHNEGDPIIHIHVHILISLLELWKDLCFRSYPVAAEQYTDGDCEEPESWREEFFVSDYRLFLIFIVRTD